MIFSIDVVGRRELNHPPYLEQLEDQLPYVAHISLRDPEEDIAPTIAAPAFHLVLGFHDIDGNYARGNAARLLTSHNGETVRPVLVIFNENQAEQIAGFVRRLHQLPATYHLIVNCEAGMCRSAAVAEVIAEWAGVEDVWHANPPFPNGHVKMLLRRALELTPAGA